MQHTHFIPNYQQLNNGFRSYGPAQRSGIGIDIASIVLNRRNRTFNKSSRKLTHCSDLLISALLPHIHTLAVADLVFSVYLSSFRSNVFLIKTLQYSLYFHFMTDRYTKFQWISGKSRSSSLNYPFNWYGMILSSSAFSCSPSDNKYNITQAELHTCTAAYAHTHIAPIERVVCSPHWTVWCVWSMKRFN